MHSKIIIGIIVIYLLKEIGKSQMFHGFQKRIASFVLVVTIIAMVRYNCSIYP